MKNSTTRQELAFKQDPPADVRHLKSDIAKLQRQLNEEKESRGYLHTVLGDVMEAIPQCESPKQKPNYQTDKKTLDKTECAHVIHLTDWHIGQITKPEYIEEFGENNYAIHEARIKTLL